MSWFARTFSYSIGRKLIMSLTGLFLVIYLIEHLIGNLLLFKSDNGVAYNEYSHFMTNNPIVKVIEILLFAAFIFHIVDAIILWARNRKSRPQGYVKNNRNQNSLWSSRNMIISGSIVFIFLVIHLRTFFFPYRVTGTTEDLYIAAKEAFSNPVYAWFYVLAMVLLGFHLQHGFSSAFQTIGMRHPKYYPFLKGLGLFLAVALSLGFASIPLYYLYAL